MNADLANHVVMVVFGILLGVILRLVSSISALDRSTDPATRSARRTVRQRIADAFDRDKVRAENKALMKSMPRSGWMAICSLYGLIAMLVIVVKASPITMRWWPFLGSLFGAFIVVNLVFSRTAAASRSKPEISGPAPSAGP